MAQRVLYDCHTHTTFCRHASGMPEEYVRHAFEAGLRGITFTCHGPVPDWEEAGLRMQVDELADYVELIERTRAKWAGTVDVLLGLESDFFPGFEPWIERLHSMAPFDFILGSVHPFIPDYQERYLKEGIDEFQRYYFRHIAEAAESGLYDSLSHPDLVKCIFPGDWDPERMEEPVCESLDRIAQTGTALEINTSGPYKAYPELQPSPFMLKEACKRDIKITLGSDAHEPERVADGFQGALEAAAKAGCTRITYFKKRRPEEVEISQAIESLKNV